MRPVLRAQGFTLVEIMVALVIGLVGITAMYQTFSVSESRKRTAVGNSDAQVSGNLGLYALQRSLRMAGYGIKSPQLLGCTVLAQDNQRVPAAFSFVAQPVHILHNAGAPDSIQFMYSGSALAPRDGVQLSAASIAGAAFPTFNATSFQAGDLVIAADYPTTAQCALFQVSAINNNNLVHTGGRYNPGNGFAIDYPVSALLFNMGLPVHDNTQPSINTFTVQRFAVNAADATLRLQSLFPYDVGGNPVAINNAIWSESVIATGVLDLQAVYGWDLDNDGVVSANEYLANPPAPPLPALPTAPPSFTQWQQLRSLRLALLVRSGKREQAVVSTALPGWSGGNFSAAQDAQWQYYRYRVYETEVPLRNMIW